LKHLDMLADIDWSQMKLIRGAVDIHMVTIRKLSDQLVEKERKSAV